MSRFDSWPVHVSFFFFSHQYCSPWFGKVRSRSWLEIQYRTNWEMDHDGGPSATLRQRNGVLVPALPLSWSDRFVRTLDSEWIVHIYIYIYVYIHTRARPLESSSKNIMASTTTLRPRCTFNKIATNAGQSTARMLTAASVVSMWRQVQGSDD
jgi:hypothetical protein